MAYGLVESITEFIIQGVMAEEMFPEFKIKNYLRELVRPWKLGSLFVGMGYYILGARYYSCPTWDIPVSIIMSVLTYIFSPWTVNSIYHLVGCRPKNWGAGMFLCLGVVYLCASGSYEVYNLWHLGSWPPSTYWVNLYYSSLMFFAAGMLWRFQGTLTELLGGLMDSTVRNKHGR